MKEFKYFMKKKQMQFIELKKSIASFILNTIENLNLYYNNIIYNEFIFICVLDKTLKVSRISTIR